MPEGITPENLLNNIMETFHDGGQKHKPLSFFQEESENSVSSQFNRLFNRQRPIHHCLGGGKSADSMLWRNKKISAGVLISATAIWVLFEWLNYNFLSLLCFGLSFGMIAQFLWANASGVINRSSSQVPRLVLPEDLFINIAKTIAGEINHGLGVLQNVASGGNLKQFGVVVLSLWAAGMIGSFCNFLTVIYIGFVAAHTLPVLYERYEDEVDGFVSNALEKLQGHYKKLDSGVRNRIPRGSFRGKKAD
ncbi:reticulon-like protein B8 [Lycium barbarum]|uniref:reticulon-like protein B8 n=1 Tax=Lycium barbarum TaxID=112863 RepID=UPI00293E5E3C|nr:reticulon-like protein B8 [Lycium barbarum]XP_060209672.1 reticulon-like protein B8 [Lycium barbarum]XP_060209673.1 reticulon-like protein B8 [Lycium barbarum]